MFDFVDEINVCLINLIDFEQNYFEIESKTIEA